MNWPFQLSELELSQGATKVDTKTFCVRLSRKSPSKLLETQKLELIGDLHRMLLSNITSANRNFGDLHPPRRGFCLWDGVISEIIVQRTAGARRRLKKFYDYTQFQQPNILIIK